MEQISGKHAFITGGASGIGRAMAHAFLDEGALVTIADYDAQNLQKLSAAFHCVTLDVRDRAQWRGAKAKAEARYGPVSILCNNAGIGPNVGELADTDPDTFDRMIAIKLTGTFNGIHAFASVDKKVIIAAPHIQQGTVIVFTIKDCKLSATDKGVVITAHNGEIS